MPALALTDVDSLAGALPFTRACRQRDIQPILGVDLSVLPHQETAWNGCRHRYTLLAESEKGFYNLNLMVSLAHKRCSPGGDGAPAIPSWITFTELGQHCEGLICLTGGPESEIFHLLKQREVDPTVTYLNQLANVFGRENLYFAIQSHTDREIRALNDRMLELAEFLGLSVVATQDVRYVKPEEELAFQFLTARQPPPVLTPTLWHRGAGHHFAAPDELRSHHAFRPHVIDSTRLIAKRCKFVLSESRHQGLSHNFERGADADSFLWNLAFERAVEHFGDITEEIKARLNHEFELIKRAGLSNYIRLLWRIVHHLDEQHITRGVGQGYLITSLIAHVLGLTQINPLEYSLRFNQPDTADDAAPILAIEVSGKHAPEILRFVRHEYGEGGVCYAGAYHGWEKRPLLQRLCQWAGVAERRTRLILRDGLPSQDRGAPRDLEALFRGGKTNLSTKSPEVLAHLFHRLQSCPHVLKARETELLISSEDLDTIVPRERLPNGDSVAQMDSEDCKRLGLARLHVLTNSSLDILDASDKWIRAEHDRHFDLNRISLTDDPTYQLLARGLTAGVPAMESPTMQALLRAQRPQNIRDLIRAKSQDPAPRPLIKSADDLMADIPNCLLAYRCAYLKAHYPASFFTALLNQARRQPRALHAALHELRHFNISIRPVDINRSNYESAQDGDAIQIGLNAVQYMGEKAAAEIQRVRLGGPFDGLIDLCHRTDARLINHRLIVSLIKAGALDSFGLRRSQLLAMAHAALEAVRGAELDDSPGLLENTPFEQTLPTDADLMALAPDLPELPATQLIKHEKEATGCAMTLASISPWLALIAASHAVHPPKLHPRQVGQKTCVAGEIGGIAFDYPLLDEDSEGLMVLDDILVLTPPRLSPQVRSSVERQAPVLIGGQVIEKNGLLFLKASWMFELVYIYHQTESIKRLIVDLEDENRQTLKAIAAVAHRYPGPTKLEILHFAGRGGWTLKRLINRGVLFTPPFYFELSKILEADRLRLVDAKDEMWPYSYLPRTRALNDNDPNLSNPLADLERED